MVVMYIVNLEKCCATVVALNRFWVFREWKRSILIGLFNAINMGTCQPDNRDADWPQN